MLTKGVGGISETFMADPECFDREPDPIKELHIECLDDISNKIIEHLRSELNVNKTYISNNGENVLKHNGTCWQMFIREDIIQQLISDVYQRFTSKINEGKNSLYSTSGNEADVSSQL